MEENNLANSLSKKRFGLSIIIIAVSLTLIALTLIGNKFIDWETAFTAIIGLVGTWVGTVLAFYFSKENFDAAAASTQKLVDSITTKEKLTSTMAKEAMIPFGKINFLTIEDGKDFNDFNLIDIKSKYLSKLNRLPILNSNGTINCILHKSLIVEFIAEQAIAGNKTEGLTLKSIISDTKFEDKAIKGFSTVKEDDTLITAKILMEKLSIGEVICSDIFVTVDGTAYTKVIGWITNKEVEKHSKV